MAPTSIKGRVTENHQSLGDIVRADVRRRARHVGRTLTARNARTHLRDVVTDRAATVRDVFHGGPVRRRVNAATSRANAATRWDRRARAGWRKGDDDVTSLGGGGDPQAEPGPECDEWSTPLVARRDWKGQRSGSCAGCRDWIVIPLGHGKVPPHTSGPPTITQCPYCGRRYPQGKGPWYTDPPCNDCARKTDHDAIADGRAAGDIDPEGDDDDDYDA